MARRDGKKRERGGDRNGDPPVEPGEGRPHGEEEGDRQDAHAGGQQHQAAAAHGHAASVDESLPATRSELLDLHAATRRQRAAAPLDSEDYRAAADLIARIEIRIAAIEQAAIPPRG